MGQITTSTNSRTKAIYRCFDYGDIQIFSEKYHAKGSAFLSCIICGRDTSSKGKSSGVIIGEGGSVIVHPQDNEIAKDGGYMGWFPIGSECIKQIPAEFRLENIYDNKEKGV